jgi:hypothetical protein
MGYIPPPFFHERLNRIESGIEQDHVAAGGLGWDGPGLEGKNAAYTNGGSLKS